MAWASRPSRLLDFLLLAPYFLVTVFLHTPVCVLNLSTFAIRNLLPLLPKPTPAPPSNSTGPPSTGGGGGGIPQIPGFILWFMDVQEEYELYIPLAEFLLTALCIRMYREQYLNLLCCMHVHRGDADGAIPWCCGGGEDSNDSKGDYADPVKKGNVIAPVSSSMGGGGVITVMASPNEGGGRWAAQTRPVGGVAMTQPMEGQRALPEVMA